MRGIARQAWLRRCCLLACLGALAGCDELPTGPDHRNPRLVFSCAPSASNVLCTATLYDVPDFGSTRNVTSVASWLVSDPSLGMFAEPGLFTPRRSGEVGLSVRYDRWESAETRWFLVDPGGPARWLYWLAGLVKDAATGGPIAGAEVRILDGRSRDARALTNSNGAYQIERILVGEVFSVMASKEGYGPVTKSYRLDPPVVPVGEPSNSPFLDFHLTRLP